MKTINAMSLFANVGIAETYFSEIGINVCVANEIEHKRVMFYKHLYPNVNMVEGDITEKRTKQLLINYAFENKVELILATPPCQGMSTAGKMIEGDERNSLICYAVDIVKKVKPRYVFFENVPEQLITKIRYKNKDILIPDYLKEELGKFYNFNKDYIINAADYGVPQNRVRAIILLTRKDIKTIWDFPVKEPCITLQDAIGDLPSLDPEIVDISRDKLLEIFPKYEEKKKVGLSISKWHYPPKHVYRQVYSLMHTPTGETAFNNIDEFKPKKKNGELVKGFKNTYKRMEWDRPCPTITMYNRTIGSQNNVHPGKYIGKDEHGFDVFSDARVLTLYEIIILSSLPRNWDVPDFATESFVRSVIGEGIPPMLTKKIMMALMENYNE